MDCSRRSVKDSSHAYDQHLLSKIGKTPSPRQSVSHGSDNRSLFTSSLPVHLRNGLPSPGAIDSSPGMLDVRWFNSPQSDRLSPGTKTGWRDYLDCPSPGADSSAPSSAVDYDLRDPYRRQTGGITPQHEDTFSLPSRSNRGSYDQTMFPDIEGDFTTTTDEYSGLSLRLREPTPPLYVNAPRPGIKRRASSPPRDPAVHDRLMLHTNTSSGELGRRKSSTHLFMNGLPPAAYIPSRDSLSASSSSSLRTHGSFSSTALSLAGTSLTSVSYDRPSPGGLSPTHDLDSLQEKPPVNIGSPGALAGLSITRSPQAPPGPLESKPTNGTRKIPMQNALRAAKAAGSKIGGLYICDCCLKKPKKFDSPEELR